MMLATLLLAAYVVAFAQRQLPAALAPAIAERFDASDFALGALHGSSFALLYGCLAVPAGWLVDRGRRTAILAAGLALASVATALSALAAELHWVAAARLVVGFGQAALVPAAYSLLGDTVPRARTGIATALFLCGPFMGAGLMLMSGGGLVSLLGWQWPFLIVGALGLVLAMLAGLLPEPVGRAQATGGASVATAWLHVQLNWRPISAVMMTMLFTATAGHVVLGWGVAWLTRVHGATETEAGLLLGCVVLIAGTGGTLAGGAVGDAMLGRRGMPRLTGLCAAATLAVPAALLTFAPAMHHPFVAFGLSATLFLLGAAHAAGPAALQEMTPPSLRGMQHGAAVFAVNLIGLGTGPLLVGLASDRAGDDGAAIGRVLYLTVPALLVMAALAALLGRRSQARVAAALAQASTPARLSSTR
jgi:MFS family permease